MKIFNRLTLTAAAIAVLAGQAGAQTLGVSTNPGQFTNNNNWSLGWVFNVTNAITVTSLGYWDQGLDGLALSHDIGIWDNAGNLMGSGTVGSGTSGTLVENFRMSTVTPFNLAAGNGYRIAATTGSEVYGYAGTITNSASVQYVTDAFCQSSTLVDPTCGGNNGIDGWFGGNFTYDNTEVTPEPASLVLMATGLLGVVAAARRRRSA